ncbi:hypothetical protein SA13_0831 [Salmonella enterica subsp. enterica serovar Agona str. 13.E.05]|nr:hypothetical protein SA32_2241 [Salmonella enterica subsp. enterica serovar Agona str. 32.A.00]CCT40505.1 hypothetical protein SA13_0831 [Salmonella enterica subsp. enterica serovar Agona str. 13.E.05]
MFPAPAGINRKIVLNDSPRGRVPRASGDKPVIFLLMALALTCSPRQRG